MSHQRLVAFIGSLCLMVSLLLVSAAHAEGNIKFGQGKNGHEMSRGKRQEDSQRGIVRAILPPVTFEESERAIRSRKLPANLNDGVDTISTGDDGDTLMMAATRVSGDAAAMGPASIAELARALRHDPDLIYEYVYNNIAYYPTWGLHKGAVGTILDNQGAAFDQADLMVKLLRESGYTANYVLGRVNMTAAQISDWLGVDTSNVCAVLSLMGNAQIPMSSITATQAGNCPGLSAALVSMKFYHLWVKVNIGGTNYYFDPSFKSHTHKSGINLTAASGYSASSYLSAARSGATVNSNYVQNINRTAIRNNLNAYASNLASHLRSNLPAASLDDVIGGKTINPHTGGALRQTTLPYQDTSFTPIVWTAIPSNYKATLRIQYQGIDRTYSSDVIYGKRLTITYNGSNQPVLKLDGVTKATGTAVSPGTATTVSFTVNHNAYSHTFANQSFSQSIKAGGTYLIGNGWGHAGRGLIENYRSALAEARAAGGDEGAEHVLGNSLGVISASWIAQKNHYAYVAGRVAQTNTLFHHQIGIAGQYTSPYVDLPGNMVSVVSEAGDAAKELALFYNNAMHGSIFESTTVEQATDIPAVSTVKLVDMAAAAGNKIFNATASNYSSAVQPNLAACGPWLSTFQGMVNAGLRLILPGRCDLTENDWSGAGYFRLSGNDAIGAIINGGLYGGFSTTPATPTQVNPVVETSTKSQKGFWETLGDTLRDPIDMAKGHFLFANEDIAVGVGEYPSSLKLRRLGSSGMRTQDGPLGRGWTHNFTSSARVGSDGFQSMGEDSALDAVPTLVETLVSLDLLADTAKPLDKMVIATLGQRWIGDQLMDNTVVVQQGLNGEVFTQLPDGSYNPPPGSSVRLYQHTDGSYRYETANKALLAFNTGGKLTTYTHPSGLQVKFSYSGDNLTQVKNNLGRTLTFSYSGGRIASIGDGTRSVGYTYDTSGNLIRFTDATSAQTNYTYDLPGRMTKFYKPSTPSTAFVSNVYDTLGRVKTQTDARGKLYNFYFAGSRTEEVGPGGRSKVSYFNAQGKITRSIDPLGREIHNTYDAHSRVVRKAFPEGNAVEYSYDDATCASTEKRCTHNLTEVRQIAKPGSGLADIVASFTYESAFNKVASSTDPRGKVTNYTYTAQGNPLTVTAPADVDGVRPVSTYAYISYSPSGFTTFYLPRSVTNKATASNSIVTTTTYNTANKYAPKTVVVDSGSGKLQLTSTFTYDSVGNLTVVNGPRTDVSDTVSYVYDAQRRVTQVTDAFGKQTRLSYDADGKPIRSAAQVGTQWLTSCTSYTATGKTLKAWGPSLTASATSCPTAAAPVPVTDYAYDDLDRAIQVTARLPSTEGGNRVTQTVYNADDSVQMVKRAVGTPLAQTYAAYTYSDNGLPLTLTDAKGNRTTYEYDGHDRQIKLRYPAPGTANASSTTDYEQFGYDVAGNLTSHRKRNGQTVTLAYDNLSRLVARNYPSSADNTHYRYDLLSRRTQVKFANGSHTINYGWDNAGRLTQATAGGKTLAYQYDKAGNRTRMTWPDTGFYVTTAYDKLNRPTVIKQQGTTNLASYDYDDLSRRTTVTLGNGTSTSYGYDARAGLSGLSHNLAGTAQDVAYSYSRNAVREITGQVWTNDLYQYDGHSNGTTAYSVNGLNQYTQAGGNSLSYDSNGNLTGDGVWSYSYDTDNKLKTATKAGYAASLAYDAEGRLRRTTLGGTTTDLLYDGAELIAEYSASGSLLRRYVHGPGVDEPLVVYEGSGTGNKSWLYRDHLGSVIGTANATGASTAIYSYGPYGEPNQSSGVRFRYTGQQYLGDLNLYYYKARFYAPTLGRFLQTDPIGTGDDLNLYAYVGNNPLNYTDPAGLAAHEAAMLTSTVVNSEAGQFGLGFVPGYDLYQAWNNPDSTWGDYALAVASINPVGKVAGKLAKVADNALDVTKKVDTPHTVAHGGNKTAGAPKTSQPNSIHEQIRPDGSRSVTYYDDKGRMFSREDYGQQRTHGVLGRGADGRSVPHEHRVNWSDRGPTGKQYRELDNNGRPVGSWHDD